MTDQELLARQDALQGEARAFEEENGIVDLLAPRCRPGSRGRAALAPLLERCRALKYADETADAPPYARHYFVFRIDGWKLDITIWTKGAPPELATHQRGLGERLDNETRLTILRLKDLWHTRPEYPETVGGFQICQAVLERGVQTPAELERYFA